MNYYSATVFLCICILSGCSVMITTETYTRLSTYQLWEVYRIEADPGRLAMIEAELGVRGETQFGVQYLGKRTSSNIGTPRYVRNAVTAADVGDLDCKDFSSSAQAQRFFLSKGGPVNDPHNLDSDGDGFACEWGRELKRIVRRSTKVLNSARRVSSAPRYSSSVCHVGPRGGTYTITSSGRKNYGGC